MGDKIKQHRILAVQRFKNGESPESICTSLGKSKVWLVIGAFVLVLMPCRTFVTGLCAFMHKNAFSTITRAIRTA